VARAAVEVREEEEVAQEGAGSTYFSQECRLPQESRSQNALKDVRRNIFQAPYRGRKRHDEVGRHPGR